jgi:predicted phosphoribosyltransferase
MSSNPTEVAAGSTIRAGILSLRKAEVGKIKIAIPTGHDSSLFEITELVDTPYSPTFAEGSALLLPMLTKTGLM